MGAERSIKTARAGWTEVVLVCRKCSKKLDGGFGPDGDQRLAKVLRRALNLLPADERARKRPKRRRARVAVVEAACFDLCPRNAVVAVRAAEPGRWLVVPAGTEIGAVAASLGLAPEEA